MMCCPRQKQDNTAASTEKTASYAVLFRSQTRKAFSKEQETARLPSALSATAVTPPVWPSKMRGGVWPSRSQTRKVLSEEPETARLPSTLTATPLTGAVWPSRTRGGVSPSRSQIPTFGQSDPETARLPSALSATALTQRCGLPGRAAESRRRGPRPQCLVVRAGDGALAVGAERDGYDSASVAFKDARRNAAVEVPDPNVPCHEARDGALAVGADAIALTKPVGLQGAGRSVPSRSQTRNVLSLEPETARLPSALSATATNPAGVALRTRGGVWPSRSQTRNVSRSEPETARLPSALSATAVTRSVWPSRTRGGVWPSRSQNRTCCRRAGDGAPAIGTQRDRLNRSRCGPRGVGRSVAIEVPDPQRAVAEPETARLPSALIATAVLSQPTWPSRTPPRRRAGPFERRRERPETGAGRVHFRRFEQLPDSSFVLVRQQSSGHLRGKLFRMGTNTAGSHKRRVRKRECSGIGILAADKV